MISLMSQTLISHKFKYLAFTCNDIYELVDVKKQAYKEGYDVLIGILNRFRFEVEDDVLKTETLQLKNSF